MKNSNEIIFHSNFCYKLVIFIENQDAKKFAKILKSKFCNEGIVHAKISSAFLNNSSIGMKIHQNLRKKIFVHF